MATDAPELPHLQPGDDAARLYLDLLKGCLTRELFLDEEVWDVGWWPERVPLPDPRQLWHVLETETAGWRLVRPNRKKRERKVGRDSPPTAETMIGRARLDNVHELAVRTLAEGVPGDFVETGVWRGGTIAFLRAVLAVYGDTERTVWACDSFQGLPEPDLERFPMDQELYLEAGAKRNREGALKSQLAVPLPKVKANIARYGLLDDRIRFLKGWFEDTLPTAPIGDIALLRLDGDLYQSTIEALTSLEHKVVPGGFIIVDDYHSIAACEQAVTDYRAEHGIDAEIHTVDWTGAWWQKPA